MKTIMAQVGADGKITLDFSGFEGKACETEEAGIRALLGRMGVATDEEFKRKEAEANVGQQINQMRQKQ
jgi:hypothetical protein